MKHLHGKYQPQQLAGIIVDFGRQFKETVDHIANEKRKMEKKRERENKKMSRPEKTPNNRQGMAGLEAVMGHRQPHHHAGDGLEAVLAAEATQLRSKRRKSTPKKSSGTNFTLVDRDRQS